MCIIGKVEEEEDGAKIVKSREILRNHVKFEVIAVQDHPMSSTLMPIESAHKTSY